MQLQRTSSVVHTCSRLACIHALTHPPALPDGGLCCAAAGLQCRVQCRHPRCLRAGHVHVAESTGAPRGSAACIACSLCMRHCIFVQSFALASHGVFVLISCHAGEQEQRFAQQTLVQFKEHEQAWVRCHQILLESTMMETKVRVHLSWVALRCTPELSVHSSSRSQSWTTSSRPSGRCCQLSRASVCVACACV
jgi:hypothetical protein